MGIANTTELQVDFVKLSQYVKIFVRIVCPGLTFRKRILCFLGVDCVCKEY